MSSQSISISHPDCDVTTLDSNFTAVDLDVAMSDPTVRAMDLDVTTIDSNSTTVDLDITSRFRCHTIPFHARLIHFHVATVAFGLAAKSVGVTVIDLHVTPLDPNALSWRLSQFDRISTNDRRRGK
jgi:hypothetical protein